MKVRRTRGNKKWLRKSLVSLIGIGLIVLSMVAVTARVFGSPDSVYNYKDSEAGKGGNGYEGCNTSNCWGKNPAFWAVFDNPNPNGTFTQEDLGILNAGLGITNMKCEESESVYVLVSKLTSWGYHGVFSVENQRKYSRSLVDGDLYSDVGNGRGISKEEAYQAFQAASNGTGVITNSDGESFTYSSPDNPEGDLGWFCGWGGDRDTIPCPDDSIGSEYGATVTRIAVRNSSLWDDWTITDPNNRRYGLPTDSDWSAGSNSGEIAEKYGYLTIAKPGDNIKFLHAVCMGARTVYRTATQDVYGSGTQRHNTQYDIPNQSFQIGANPGYYLFGNGVEMVNNQSRNVSAKYQGVYDNKKANGEEQEETMLLSVKKGKGLGIAVASPTSDNSDYDCNGIGQYSNWANSYNQGYFQIPDFSSGQNCNSASRTQVRTVGNTIEQYHTFDSLRVWEQYYSSVTGSCGCDNNSARIVYNNTLSDYYWDNRDSTYLNSERSNRREYQCQSNGTCCKGSCNCGENGCSCCSRPTTYKLTSGSDDRKYRTVSKSTSERKFARVYVPYNFETSVKTVIDTNSVVYQGSGVRTSYGWSVDKRKNLRTTIAAEDDYNFNSYATSTPDNTRVQMVEFILKPDAEGAISGRKDSSEDPCAYYTNSNHGAVKCTLVKEETGNQNPQGLYTGKESSAIYTRLIPDDDEYVGYKYCIAVGVWPSDSHDYMGNELWQQYSTGKGGAMDAGEYWNVSNASCRTIAKKPSFQVWNGSIYTQGEVSAAITRKMAGKTGAEEQETNYHSGEVTLFGSWVDYAIVTDSGSVNGVSSGAVVGYHNEKYNLYGGGISTQIVNNYDVASPMTISNNSPIGVGRVNASASVQTNLQRLYSRYREKARTYAIEDGYTSQKTINTHSTGMQYVYYNGDLNISELDIRKEDARPNQTTYREGSNLVKTAGDGDNDNTLVIHVKGNLTIDNNICLGSGCNSDPTRLRTYSSVSTNSSAKLPQVLIFADNIYITQDVNRVDAWLVAADGTIDTCKGFNIGNNLMARDARQRYATYGNCYKTLVVNGPVYAHDIALKRTAGNNHGFAPEDDETDVLDKSLGSIGVASDANKGSVAPAEIFNLRADVYIWSYNQAERYSEAVVTYLRELAPRY